MEQQSGRQIPMAWRVAAASVSAAALFLVLSCCLPLNFLAALPCAQVRARQGTGPGWLVSGVAGLLVTLVSVVGFGLSDGLQIGMQFFGLVAVPAVVMTGWAVRGVRTDQAALAGLAAGLVLLAAFFIAFTLDQGKGPGTYLDEHEHVVAYFETLEASAPEEQRAEFGLMLGEVRELLFDFLFALIGVLMITGLTVVAAVMARSLRFGAPERFPALNHREVMLPQLLVFVFIITGLLTLVPVDALRAWCYNVLIILVFIYFLGGLSILAWFLARFNVPLVFKVLLFLLVMLHGPLALLVAGVGLFDNWFDFRKLRQTG
jgi:hypothetical protein